MAQVMTGANVHLPLFFNISNRVGAGCANATEDVVLASYLMRLSGKSSKNPKAREICQNTAVTYSATDDFIKSITDLQCALGIDADGRISPSSSNGMYSGGRSYLIANFNKNVRVGYADLWPRIDRIPDISVPALVTALVHRTVIGLM